MPLAMLPDLLLAALKREQEARRWQTWLAFAPFSLIAGKMPPEYKNGQIVAPKKGGTDDDIQKIRKKFNL